MVKPSSSHLLWDQAVKQPNSQTFLLSWLWRDAVTLGEPWHTSVEVDQEISFINHYTSSIIVVFTLFDAVWKLHFPAPIVGSSVQLHPLTHAQFVNKADRAETKFEVGASDRNLRPVVVDNRALKIISFLCLLHH